MLWVGRELIIVMLARKNKTKKTTHTRIHIWDQNSSSVVFERIVRFLGTVRSIKNVKQANVKMLLSALAPCVYRISGIRFFYKQVEPHVP